ncbi:MAG TPA: DUF1206 domain-containing protein [Gemmatimonadaceae bacterium]
MPREAAPWIERGARLGYAAKGIVYLVIGALAALAAAGKGGQTTDSRGALRAIDASGPGHWLLLVLGAGLVGYAVWGVVGATIDAERRGGDAKGLALRVGLAARGLAYGALGIAAFRLFFTARGSSGEGAEHWTGRLLGVPFGRALVIGAGIAIIGYALYQFWRAARKNLRKRLHLAEAGPGGAAWVLRLARFGIAARGVVFLVIGWFLVTAARTRDPSRAGGIADSLDALRAQPYGALVLGTVAVGLMAFGVWELANARYRDINVR